LLQFILILMKTLKNGEYEYSESDFLGEGSFAKVYRGVIVKSKRVVAVRLLPLKLIKQYGNKIKTIISITHPIKMARSPCSRNWLSPPT
jgi:serine/threonine protein kinase